MLFFWLSLEKYYFLIVYILDIHYSKEYYNQVLDLGEDSKHALL
jgi:hypothetical protein